MLSDVELVRIGKSWLRLALIVICSGLAIR